MKGFTVYACPCVYKDEACAITNLSWQVISSSVHLAKWQANYFYRKTSQNLINKQVNPT